jgi:hypothetical protein
MRSGRGLDLLEQLAIRSHVKSWLALQNDYDHLRELDALARQIDHDMPDERMTSKEVAKFQTGLLQFMENALGPNVRSSPLLRCYSSSQSFLQRSIESSSLLRSPSLRSSARPSSG